MARRLSALFVVVALLLASVAPATVVARNPDRTKPVKVESRSDRALAKLDAKLRDKIASGSTEHIHVFATVVGDPAPALARLENGHAAATPNDQAALVVGSIAVQQLPKLAGAEGVRSVRLIELRKTGSPLGSPEPELNNRPSLSSLQSFLNDLQSKEVPYSAAPPLRGSNFEQLKELALLDAKTHNFVGAWNAGYTGEGSTVAVLDGGTDFGHPDLIGTWRTRTSGEWAGWAQAFDPYGTLVQLVAPSFVDQGLTWFVKTVVPKDRPETAQDKKAGLTRVQFATRRGPARNFSAPNATATHDYTFPAAWTKSGTVRMGFHPDDHLLQLFAERPAVLVVDATTAGAYDTVYVDLDNDRQFADEKPVNKASPASWRDMNGDGYTDLSGGLLYWISDGASRIPGGLTAFLGGDTPRPASGHMLAFTGDFDPLLGGHGTLTASNVAGQGVINGLAPTFGDVPGGTYPGAVIGGAPNADLVPFGDIYFSFSFSTQFAYLLTALNGVDVTSNSYGNDDVDNDGYDAASQEADLWHALTGNRTLPVFSTGNGAPGYGTTAPPSPYGGLSVGASTQFGGTGWDSIRDASQIVDNDVMVWSNRGPGATGANGVDVVADGAFSAGDTTLNTVLDGRVAWETWGGTSRSTPVTAGALALVYQSWRANRGPIPTGFAFSAKDIIRSSAADLGYEAWIQGSGSVDAGRAVALAAGSPGTVSPSSWRPGDYRGDEYQVFTHVLKAGETDTQRFQVAGSGAWSLSDRYLRRTDSVEIDFTTARVNKESKYNFNAPDYLLDISEIVEDHAGADVMIVRANFPYASFDANGDYVEDQQWRLLTYDWTDVNGDGNLWTDADNDGAVDHVQLPTSTKIDGEPDINFAASEVDQGEYVRFMYHRAFSNTLQNFVRDPAERMSDGIFLGLQHTVRNPGLPQTSFDIQIDFYENEDWPWLTVPASASGSFDATLSVPADTPAGMYDGAIVASKDGHDAIIPVSVTVAIDAPQDAEGKLSGSVSFGGADVAAAQADLPYNNGSVFGASDWSWRSESGDWRFFYLDVTQEPAPGSLFLANTKWQGLAPHTDLDTLVFGRATNHYQVGPIFGFPEDPIGAPYILGTVGNSPNTNTGAGVWTFNTATGGAEELVAAPAQEGLHAIVQHQVGFEGDAFHVPFETTLGSATVDPAAVEVTTTADTGGFDITFQASVDLPGLAGDGFGLSQPVTTTETAAQDDPDVPASASVKKTFTVAHASRVTVTTALAQDLDLYVVYDANGDGTFAASEVVGSSAGPDGNESVTLVGPPDGNYQAWVQGFAISGSPTFPLTIDAVQGTDLTISGLTGSPIPADTPVVVHVDFSKAMTAGQDYFGEVQLGPPAAPNALSIPVTIHRN